VKSAQPSSESPPPQFPFKESPLKDAGGRAISGIESRVQGLEAIMSWDIFVQDFPVDAKTIEDIPVDFEPRTIGRRSEVIEKIKGILPDADFSDPSWGRVEMPECSMEINMGDAV
jgi:hypothetical protein